MRFKRPLVELPPSPNPLVLYSFVAFFFTLFAFREAYDTEATLFETAIWIGLSIGSLVIAILKWRKGTEEERDIVGSDALNRSVSKLMMRFWLVFAAIGAILVPFTYLDSDWFLGGAGASLTVFCGYYAYANWQNSRNTSVNASRG